MYFGIFKSIYFEPRLFTHSREEMDEDANVLILVKWLKWLKWFIAVVIVLFV